MPGKRKSSKSRQAILRTLFVVWVALIAFGIPEIIAGTGRMWITNPGSYVMVIPLYLLHFLFLTHVAIRSGRTSWPALYLFGVLFGLYETWITKVVWKGYPGSDGFSFGSFGPWFGIHETLGLILFYHAVVSFLLPLAVISRLFPAFGAHFPVPDWVFGATKTAMLRRLGLLFILGVVTGHNNPVPMEFLVTWVPWLFLIWAGYLLLARAGAVDQHPDEINPIARPWLSRFGVLVTVVLLVAMYVVPYIYILPESRPPAYIQLITLGFYPVLVWLLSKCGRNQTVHQHPKIAKPARLPFRWIIAVFVIGIVGIILNGYAVGIRGGFAVVAFLSMVPLGAGLFMWLGIWKTVLRR